MEEETQYKEIDARKSGKKNKMTVLMMLMMTEEEDNKSK